MSVQVNQNGTITITSDSNPSITQTLPANSTPQQILSAQEALFPLSDFQAYQQGQLDTFFNANFDLAAFIRGGQATNVSATGVGTFLATICNNYRTLRAQIAAASTPSAVLAINILSGWPSNP